MDTPNNAKTDPSLLHLNETRSLQRRIEELEMERQHAQLTTVRGREQIQAEETRQIEKMNAEVARQSAALQEQEENQTQSEQTLRAEIDRLVRESQEKNLILQSRNDELGRLKADREAPQNSKDLESATSRNETAMSEDAKNMRMEFQAQLALLQADLSQRDSALAAQRVATNGIILAHREQIDTLRQRLAQTEGRVQEHPDKFVPEDETLTDEHQQRGKKYPAVIDAVPSDDDRSFPVSENRRWHRRFGWKRRWK
jgi:hypothetical protein